MKQKILFQNNNDLRCRYVFKIMELTHKQKVGQIGENIAVKHLEKLKFRIIDRNYRKKWG